MRKLVASFILSASLVPLGCHHYTCDMCNGCGGCMDTGVGVYVVPYAQPRPQASAPTPPPAELIKPLPMPK